MQPTWIPAGAPPALLLALLFAAVALPALAPRGAGAERAVLDMGQLTISQDGQPVRAERFSLERYGDSLLVRAASAPWRAEESSLRFDKRMQLVVGAAEFDLISYSSQWYGRTDTVRRGITLAHGDTTFTLWREGQRGGTADILAMPPGRMYILDAPLFTLFGYIGWTVQGRVFDRRPLHAMVLGARDTLVEATVTDAGTQELTWNGEKVTTRKLLIGDQQTTVDAWFTPDGHLLRLEQLRAGIRAERDAPAAAEPARKEPPAPTK
jgi:hypothetical protein